MHHYLEQNQGKGFNNACALLIDYQTMEVRAAVGSANYRNKQIQGQVNGLKMQRSPGSALKPFIYGLALDQGLIHPNSLLKDEFTSFNGYNPENFDRSFMGPLSATRALVESRNVPAVNLESELSTKNNLYTLLHHVGIRRLLPPEHYGLTIALGSAEISPEDMAQLYCTLANGGIWHGLRYGLDDPLDAGKKYLSPEASYLILDMLATGNRPHAVDVGGMVNNAGPVAFKTGTSFSFRDAWTASVFDHYVMIVWVGNFNGEQNGAFVGRTAAAPLAFAIIDALRASKQVDNRPTCFTPAPTLNIRKVSLCADSGALATPMCPHVIQGWFIPGVSPITPCDIHRRIWVDNKSGKRWPSFPPDPAQAHSQVAEFWPSDLSRLFAEAGVPRRPPPPLIESATTNQKGTVQNGPHIMKPASGLIFHLRLSAHNSEILDLQARVETSQETVHWFVDASCVGTSLGSEPLAWTPRSGTHIIRAVDDDGRSDSRTITITTVE